LLLLSEKSGRFGINDYKLFGSFGTHSVWVYILENRPGFRGCYTHICNCIRTGSVSQRIWIQNIFGQLPLRNIFNNLCPIKINMFVSSQKMPPNFCPECVQLKRDVASRVQRKLKVVCWKKKQEVYALSNMYVLLVMGHFKETGKSVKPFIFKDCTVESWLSDLWLFDILFYLSCSVSTLHFISMSQACSRMNHTTSSCTFYILCT
jgi:hypothetical protein